MLSDPLEHVGDRTEGGSWLEKPSGIWLRQLYWVKKFVLQQLLQSNSI